MHIEIGIERIHHESLKAIRLIEKTFTKNNINRVLRISYDYESDDAGCYYPTMKTDTIFINPDNCYNIKEYNLEDYSLENIFYHGYARDNSIFGTILHEFGHYICYQIFKNLLDEYKKQFPNVRLYLNSYSNCNYEEEVANLIALYISNPYLLKLISNKHFIFFKSIFKSPTPSTNNTCFNIYQQFPIHVKTELKTKWGIIYNLNTKKFENIEINNNIKEKNEV